MHHALLQYNFKLKGFYQFGPRGPHPCGPRAAGQEKILGPRAALRSHEGLLLPCYTLHTLLSLITDHGRLSFSFSKSAMVGVWSQVFFRQKFPMVNY